MLAHQLAAHFLACWLASLLLLAAAIVALHRALAAARPQGKGR